MSHERHNELQALEDSYWMHRAREAENDGYAGSAETMAVLTRGLSENDLIGENQKEEHKSWCEH